MPRALLCAALFAFQTTASTPPSLRPDDDRQVIDAVFAHTVQPEADLWRRDPRPLKILSQSIGACGASRGQTCLSGLDLLREAKRPPAIGYNDSTGPEPGELMPDESVRLELIASATDRNRARHALPIAASPSVTLVPEADEPDLLIRNRDSARYACFSLPGYTREGHAVIYSFYACGARCGKSWLFVLDREGSGWRVRSRYMLGIR
jgi:hypothetical protein